MDKIAKCTTILIIICILFFHSFYNFFSIYNAFFNINNAILPIINDVNCKSVIHNFLLIHFDVLWKVVSISPKAAINWNKYISHINCVLFFAVTNMNSQWKSGDYSKSLAWIWFAFISSNLIVAWLYFINFIPSSTSSMPLMLSSICNIYRE